MSLMSIIQNNSTTLTYGTSTSASAAKAAAILAAREQTTSTASSDTSSSSGVQISKAAIIAAAEKTDNAASFSDLSATVRSTFDAEYKAAGTADKKTHAAPDVSELSGRALAAVILNKSGTFSKQEISTARTELNSRTRTDVMSAIGTGTVTIAGIAAYSKNMVSAYDAISPEERQARGWSEQTRATAAQTAQTANTPSLFDQLD